MQSHIFILNIKPEFLKSFYWLTSWDVIIYDIEHALYKYTDIQEVWSFEYVLIKVQ